MVGSSHLTKGLGGGPFVTNGLGSMNGGTKMSKVTEKNTVVAIKEESSYAADPGPTLAAADCISTLKGTTYKNDYEELTSDDVVRNTFSEAESSRGGETSALEIQTALVGGGRSTDIIVAPEHSVLYKCGFGGDHVLAANDAVTAPAITVNTCTVTLPANFKKGDGIIIANTTDGFHLAFIIDVTGSVITWWPSCANMPTAGDAIYTGANYRLASVAGVESELPSFFMRKWLHSASIDDRFEYFGQMVKSFKFNFSSSQHVNPAFSTDGQKVVVTALQPHGFTGIAYDVDARSRMVAVNMQVKLDKATPVTFACQNVELSIENTLFDPRAVTTSGRSEMVRTDRKVRGSLEFFYESAVAFQDFKAETKFKLLLLAHGGGSDDKPVLGNSFALYAPKIKFLSPDISVDSGLYKYTIPFQCLATIGGDELFGSFL